MEYKLGDTILCIQNLSVGYKDKLILKDVNLIEKDVIRAGVNATGQKIAFIGRSGRGKSTIFKAMTGLLAPTTGQILITDVTSNVKGAAKIVKEGDIGFVDQKYTVFRHKTVFQICHYALRKSKMMKKDEDEYINQCLKEWGLYEVKDSYSCELSGGQKQRTALLEQFIADKHFMILDEPFSGLDVGNIETVKAAITKITSHNELNTVIFSTHDIKLAVELADSIYIIGHPEGHNEYSTIVKHYDLKAMGLAWTPYGDEHRKLCTDIKDLLLKS